MSLMYMTSRDEFGTRQSVKVLHASTLIVVQLTRKKLSQSGEKMMATKKVNWTRKEKSGQCLLIELVET